MSARVTFATAARVLTQLRRDPRTVALLLARPVRPRGAAEGDLRRRACGLPDDRRSAARPLPVHLDVPRHVDHDAARARVGDARAADDAAARTSSTSCSATRSPSPSSPPSRSTLVSVVAFGLLDLRVAGPKWAVVLLAIGNALLGMSLGLFVSAFATTEFQAVQFMPALVFPQLLLCGLFVARAEMAEWLQVVSAVLPLTYAYDALAQGRGGRPVRRSVRRGRGGDRRRDAAAARPRRGHAAAADALGGAPNRGQTPGMACGAMSAARDHNPAWVGAGIAEVAPGRSSARCGNNVRVSFRGLTPVRSPTAS